jgi:hypothetical protein
MIDGRIGKPVLIATLVCGTLDILLAVILTTIRGRQIPDMLRYVASGPFPHATEWSTAGAVLGLAVHLGLMAVMVGSLSLLVRSWPGLLDTPWRTAIVFGLVTYLVMNWAVVPLRFHTPLPPSPLAISTQLFAHIVLVGLPATFIARRYLRG